MTPFSSRPLTRSKLTRESFCCASAAASCERSSRVSSCTRTVPSRTAFPESKWIWSTMPGRSALTVTPCTAATVPISARFAGHCSCRATIVVTASGGGWKDECSLMAFLTWPYFTAPMAVMKTAMANAISVIRFFMRARPPISTGESVTGRASSRRFLDFDAPLLEQDAGGAGELGLRLAVVGQRRGLGDPGVGQVVLTSQDEEVCRKTHLEPLLFGVELRLGGDSRGSGCFDPLACRVEREDRVADLGLDLLLGRRDADRGL